MAAQTVLVGKRRFVCGLFWQSLSRPREAKAEAGELARRLKFDLIVLLKDFGSMQAGFASSNDGVKRGTYSLAAGIARSIAVEGAYYDGKQQPAANWLAAFKLGDSRWAYFAVRDDSFLPNGDIIGTREEVIDRLQADYALGGWNAVFGEEELRAIGFHNFQAKRLTDMLPRGKSGAVKVEGAWALQGVSQQRQLSLLATAGLSVAVVVAALLWGHHARRLGSLREQALRAVGTGASAPGVAGRPVPPPHRWPTQPLPRAFVQACVPAFGDLAPGGWQLESFECANGLVTHVWQRGSSTIDYLLQAVPDANVDLDGERARLSRPLGVPPSARDEPLSPARDVLDALLQGMQQLGLKLKLTAIAPPPTPPRTVIPGVGGPVMAPPDWQTFRFDVAAGDLAPEDLLPVLDRQGVRIEKMSFNGHEWSIQGEIYAK